MKKTLTQPTRSYILEILLRQKRKQIFFSEDFTGAHTAKAVSKALQRLVAEGRITRICTGMYVRAAEKEVFSMPDTNQIIEAIKQRDNAYIQQNGLSAAHSLGLTDQVPMRSVYLTNGPGRKIQLGKRTIVLKKTSVKNVATKGIISGMVIRALKSIGKNKITGKEIVKVITLLKKEEKELLLFDLKLAPEWIRTIMRQAIEHK